MNDKESMKKDNAFWKPEAGDIYYLTHSNPCQHEWHNTSEENMYYDIGLVHRTRDEAKEDFEIKKCTTLWKKLSDSSGENENKWDKINRHYFIIYDFLEKSIRIDTRRVFAYEGIYFATEESLEHAIKLIGEEKVKKYILGIEEDDSK